METKKENAPLRSTGDRNEILWQNLTSLSFMSYVERYIVENIKRWLSPVEKIIRRENYDLLLYIVQSSKSLTDHTSYNVHFTKMPVVSLLTQTRGCQPTCVVKKIKIPGT